MRFDVLAEEPTVQIGGARAQAGTFGDPRLGVLGELDLAPVGIGPLARRQLGLDEHERPVGVALALVGFRAGSYPPVRARVADLVPAGRQLWRMPAPAQSGLLGLDCPARSHLRVWFIRGG